MFERLVLFKWPSVIWWFSGFVSEHLDISSSLDKCLNLAEVKYGNN